MKDQEANKIITEFMGWRIQHNGMWLGANYMCHAFTASLDALVPVWERLSDYGYKITLDKLHESPAIDLFISIPHYDEGEFFKKEMTIQQAAAHATAKAIMELEK